jgi:hypothetical protein
MSPCELAGVFYPPPRTCPVRVSPTSTVSKHSCWFTPAIVSFPFPCPFASPARAHTSIQLEHLRSSFLAPVPSLHIAINTCLPCLALTTFYTPDTYTYLYKDVSVHAADTIPP